MIHVGEYSQKKKAIEECKVGHGRDGDQARMMSSKVLWRQCESHLNVIPISIGTSAPMNPS